jgi:hypothetical protein
MQIHYILDYGVYRVVQNTFVPLLSKYITESLSPPGPNSFSLPNVCQLITLLKALEDIFGDL